MLSQVPMQVEEHVTEIIAFEDIRSSLMTRR